MSQHIRRVRVILTSTLSVLLGACSLAQPPQQLQPPPVAPQVSGSVITLPEQWQAPLPHGGQLAQLRLWWQQYQDPALLALIEAAQSASPGLASARARVAQARANQVAARASQGPALDASLSASRGISAQTLAFGGPATVQQLGLQASWELDLFGALDANTEATRRRLMGAEAQWHEARVAVAAETAQHYLAWRACERLTPLLAEEATSWASSASLAHTGANAGVLAPNQARQSQAAAAEAASRLTTQRDQCQSERLALLALTGLAETRLRELLSLPTQTPDQPAFTPDIPARLLEQRPDVYQAAQEMAAASADLYNTQAQRYPRLALTGSIGALRLGLNGASNDFSTWSIGPLTLSLPLWDGGRRQAQTDAASARYEAAVIQYQAQARLAVREVEQALLTLRTLDERQQAAERTEYAQQLSWRGSEARHQVGSASQIELEEARRARLQAQTAVLNVQRDQALAWITLYRTVGGGWTANQDQPR